MHLFIYVCMSYKASQYADTETDAEPQSKTPNKHKLLKKIDK